MYFQFYFVSILKGQSRFRKFIISQGIIWRYMRRLVKIVCLKSISSWQIIQWPDPVPSISIRTQRLHEWRAGPRQSSSLSRLTKTHGCTKWRVECRDEATILPWKNYAIFSSAHWGPIETPAGALSEPQPETLRPENLKAYDLWPTTYDLHWETPGIERWWMHPSRIRRPKNSGGYVSVV